MVYAHQHQAFSQAGKITRTSGKGNDRPAIKEKCDLCDVMHHNAMLLSAQNYLQPANISHYVNQSSRPDFKSIQLILSGGRAPPLC
jgi:hypothetical protein